MENTKASMNFNSAKAILLNKIKSGYKPYYNTLVKYNLQHDYEARDYTPKVKRVNVYIPRSAEVRSQWNKKSYEKHRERVLKQDTLRRLANGQKVKPSTLAKHQIEVV